MSCFSAWCENTSYKIHNYKNYLFLEKKLLNNCDCTDKNIMIVRNEF